MKTIYNLISTKTNMIVRNILPPILIVVFISMKVQTILLERVVRKKK